MSTDHTQHQSPEEVQRARDLSLARTQPPARVEGYEATSLLGRGAFGEVWVGVDRNTGRQVAIKFYNQRSRLDWTLLTREVEKLVFLAADRYVVQLLDVGWDADPPYYVMEYIEQGSLEDLLRRRGPLPPGDAVELFREIAIGLMHAHGKGVLHCDLKPANVLLDQDHKPRLADFGQSRLSHEQSPALGTLFYMAPEQADLDAVPDARWDVYALGALLYSLLTGSPPHRSDEFLRQLHAADSLRERLAVYRRRLRNAPAPVAHRRVRGVDRALSDIVERCLASDPQRRFANIQAVLDALHARDRARIRTPLVLLGFVGPVLLLAIMALFGLRGYERAVSDSEEIVSLRARESNDMAAKFAAGSIEGEIAKYFQLIGDEAKLPDLHDRFAAAAELPIVTQLNERNRRGEPILRLREQFIDDPVRRALNEYLDRRLEHYLQLSARDPRAPKLASLFVVDRHGRMLAVAYDHNRPSGSIGWNFAHRTYYHGGAADLSDGQVRYHARVKEGVEPIGQTHFSAAFRSTTSGLWKIAVSTPIRRPDDPQRQTLGLLALTVNLGDFAYFRSSIQEDRFATLVDGRAGPNHGVILQHPLLDEMDQNGNGAPINYTSAEYRVTDEQLLRLRGDAAYRYTDPLSRAPGGSPYLGDWIAAVANVRLPDARPGSGEMFVLVQERFRDAVAPVKQLGSQLKQEGIWALGGVTGVILVLWYIVLRMLSEPRFVPSRRPVASSSPTPVNGLTTVDR